MSEQKVKYTVALTAWVDEMVIKPLLQDGAEESANVRKAIREKVLESYRNGIKAGAAVVRKDVQKG